MDPSSNHKDEMGFKVNGVTEELPVSVPAQSFKEAQSPEDLAVNTEQTLGPSPALSSWWHLSPRTWIITLVVLLLGGGGLGYAAVRNYQADLASRQITPLTTGDFTNESVISVDPPVLTVTTTELNQQTIVNVNGALRVDNSLTLAPSEQPTDLQTGLLFTSNVDGELYYYDGSTLAKISDELNFGAGLTLSGDTVTNSGVTSILGTANQVIASSSTGDITLSLPQSISTSSSPSFAGLALSGNLLPNADNTIDIGSPSLRFANIYATNIAGTFSPSGLTEGSVVFAGPGSTLTQDNANFFWDDTNNRFGIGTSTPGAMFNVDGDLLVGTTIALDAGVRLQVQGAASEKTAILRANASSPGNVLEAQNSSGTALFALSPSTQFTTGSIPFFAANGVLAQDNTNFFWDDTNSRLGVGTTSPTSPLHVRTSIAGATVIAEGANNDPRFVLYNDNGGVDAANNTVVGRLDFRIRHAGASNLQVAQISSTYRGDGTTRAGDLRFATGDGVGQPNVRMIINEAGDVGIGSSTTIGARLNVQGGDVLLGTTTALDAGVRLQVQGAASEKTAILRANATTPGNILELQTSTPITVMSVSATGAALFQNSTDTLTGFQIFDADGGTPILNVDTTNERLGIGTAAPSTTLHVEGSARITGLVSCNTIDTDADGLLMCGSDATGGGGSGATNLQEAYDGGNTINVVSTEGDLAFTLTSANFTTTTPTNGTNFTSLLRGNGSGTADPAQLLLLDNLDIDRSQPIGLKIQSAAGGLATAIDLSDGEIVTALAIGSNDVTVGGATLDATEFAALDSGITLTTETNGDYVASLATGSGLSGGAAGSEGAILSLALGALTADWNQTGAFDIILNNADSQLQIKESAGDTFFGTIDVGDLSANRTYTFPDATGTVCLSSGNCVGSAGGAAPNDAQYLTLALDDDLSVERVFTSGTNISFVDGGANGNLTVSTVANPTFSASVTSPLFTNAGQVVVSATGAGNDVTITPADQLVISTLGTGVLHANASGVITSSEVALTTDTSGNYVATITAGNGISGSSASEGGTPTIALGPLTADWDQTGAFDIVLNNAGSELRIKESAGDTFFGTIDVGNLNDNRTYTLPDANGTFCLTSGNCAGVGGQVGGTGTANRVAYWTTSTDIGADDDFFFDGSDIMLGTSTALDAGVRLQVLGAANEKTAIFRPNATNPGATLDVQQSNGTSSFLVQPAAANSTVVSITGAHPGTGTTLNGFNSQVVFPSTATLEIRQIRSRTQTAAASFTVDTSKVFYIDTPSLGAGSSVTHSIGYAAESQGAAGVANAYGMFLKAQTGASTLNIGARIDAATTQTLWLDGNADNTTPNAGIAFGMSRDTNLYRSAADTLKTDDGLIVTNDLLLGTGTALDAGVRLQVQGAASEKTAIFKAHATNPGSVLEVQNSAGTPNFTVDSAGRVGIATAGGASDPSILILSNGDHPGTATSLYGAYLTPVLPSTTTTLGVAFRGRTQTAAASFTLAQGNVFRAIPPILGSGSTIALQIGFRADNQGKAGVTDAIGLYVDTQSGATNNYGVNIAAATTQTLLISSDVDNTTASAGIAFGPSRDTVLYRGAANQLKTDDQLSFNGAATDITTGTDQNLTIIANGAGVVELGNTEVISGSSLRIHSLSGSGSEPVCRTATLYIGSCTGAGANTLQGAYDGGNTITSAAYTGGRDIEITLADTATDSVFEIYQAGTVDAFRVNDETGFTDATPFVIDASGNVGIGDSTPAALLSVGDGDDFQVSSTGTLTFNGVATDIATTSNGALTLAPNGSGSVVINSGVTTQTGLLAGTVLNFDTVTSGTGLYLTAGNLTSGVAMHVIGNTVQSSGSTDSDLAIFSLGDSSSGTYSGTVTGATFAFSNTSTVAHTQYGVEMVHGLVGSFTDSTTDALLRLDQQDTTATGNTALTSAILITNTGGSTLTNALTIGSGSQAIGTGINLNSTGITTGINFTAQPSSNYISSTNFTVANTGLITTATLGTANTATYLCRNSSNQVATCNTIGTGAAFIQGGNSFGSQAILGTNDDNSLAFETNTVTRWVIETDGDFVPQSDDDYDIGSTALRVQDIYLGPTSLHVLCKAAECTTQRDWALGVQETDGATEGNFRLTVGGSDLLSVTPTGNVGVGDTSPAALFTVGSGDLFRVDSSGRVLAPNGASGAGNLAYSFVNDSDTGFYLASTNQIRFQTNGSDRVTLDASGNLGIGDTDPSEARLTVVGAVTPTVNALFVDGDSTQASGNTIISAIRGTQSVANTGSLIGSSVAPNYTASSGNTLAALYGVASQPANDGTGTITTIYALLGNPRNVSTGTVDNAYGLYSRVDNASTGTVTSAYGVFIATPVNSGTITNKYALITEAGAGNVGIGTTTPTAKLQVNGAAGTSSGTTTMTASSAANTFTTSAAITINTGDIVVPTTATGQARTVTSGGTGTSFTVGVPFSAAVSAQTFTIYPAISNTQNNLGNSVLAVSQDSNFGNLVTNPTFETGTSGWSAKGAATLSQNFAHQYYGNASLKIATTAAAGDGAKFNFTFTESATYTLSFYVRTDVGGSLSTLNVGRQDDGSTDTDCLTGQSVSGSGWKRITCTFVAGAQSGTPNFYVKQTDAASRNLYIDGVTLENALTGTVYRDGSIYLGGSITSPLTLQNSIDSTTAFQVLNSAGTSNLVVDTLNGNVGIGTAIPPLAKLQVAAGNVLLDNNQALQFKGVAGDVRSLVSFDASDTQIFGTINNNATLQGFTLNITAARPAGAGTDSIFDITSSVDLGASDELLQVGDSAETFLTILGNGNVGIGTAGPSSILHVAASVPGLLLQDNDSTGNAVAGILSIRDSALTEVGYFGDGSGSTSDITVANLTGTGNLTFLTNSSEKLRIEAGGNVGIGTNDPTELLELNGTTATTNTILVNNSSTAGPALKLSSTDTGGRSYSIISTASGNGPGAGFLGFADTTGAAAYRMVINSSGNVGIGTNDPDSKLDVSGAITLSGNAVANGPSISNSDDGMLLVSGATSGIRFNNQGNTVELVRITNAGNVGIGTPSPTEGALVVKQTSNTQYTSGGGITLEVSGATNKAAILKGSDNNLYVFSGNNYMTLNESGDVGIGSTAPVASTKLFVNGSGRFDGAGKIYLGMSPPSGARGLQFTESSSTVFDISHHDPGVAWQNISIGGPGNGKLSIGDPTTLASSNLPAGSVVIANGALCVDNGGNNCDDAGRTAGIVHSVGADVTNVDVAENYPTKDLTLTPGEIVSLESDGSIPFVRRSTADRSKLMGVISTAPGLLLGGFGNEDYASEHKVPVALNGRVPVKVNSENGPIAAGDAITASSSPGTGMKATTSGRVIGVALQDFNSQTGTILVFVNPHYFIPSDNQADTQVASDPDGSFNNLESAGLATLNNLTVTGTANFNSLTASNVTISGVLTASEIEVANITISGHIVTAGAAPTITAMTAACGGSIIVAGTDTAGGVEVTTGGACAEPGELMQITFSQAFGKPPRVLLTAANAAAAGLKFYQEATATGYKLMILAPADASTTYKFDYFVIE